MGRFELKTTFEPAGDQPQAIASLCAGLDQGMPHQVLLGATGTGRCLIAEVVHANAAADAFGSLPLHAEIVDCG